MVNSPAMTSVRPANFAFSDFQRFWFGFVADATIKEFHGRVSLLLISSWFLDEVRDVKHAFFKACPNIPLELLTS
jgi:hypothetical protein